MPIRLTLIVDKGEVRIKTDWANINDNTIKDYCKLLLNLQNGQCGTELIESVELAGKTSGDKDTSNKIVKRLMKQEDFLEMPIVSPKDVGEEIYLERK